MKKALLVLVVLLLPACSDLFNPLEDDPEEAGITINVVECEVDESGVPRATAEVTSEQAHDNVLLRGELIGDDGVVLQQTSTSLQGVKPGRTYRTRLTFGSISKEDAEGKLDCVVELDFATDIPG